MEALSLARFWIGGIIGYIYTQTSVFGLPTGLGANNPTPPAAKISVQVHELHTQVCLEPYFPDSTDVPTSNGYNSLIINPNWAKFVFKLKLKMSTFQQNKPH